MKKTYSMENCILQRKNLDNEKEFLRSRRKGIMGALSDGGPGGYRLVDVPVSHCITL